MAYSKFILAALSLLLLLTYKAYAVVDASSDPITIYQVTTKPLLYNDETRKGSIYGGTQVTIKIVGHSSMYNENLILIGPYPCEIPEKGVSGVYILCTTTEALDPADRNVWLPVTVTVQDKGTSICAEGSKCTYMYAENYTPRHKYIIPRAARPNEDITWYGLWRVSSGGSVKKMLIGDYLCDRFELKAGENIVLNDDREIDPNDYVFLDCTVSKEQTAGRYQTQLESVPGHARQYETLNTVTVDGTDYYQFTVVPSVLSVSSHIGSTGGARIFIKGEGFSKVNNENVVKVAGKDCTVQASSFNSIECTIAGDAIADDVEIDGKFTGGSGLKYIMFANDGHGLGSAQSLRYNIQGQPNIDHLQDVILEEGYMSEPDFIKFRTQYSVFFTGYFKAPRDGDYRFYASADDSFILDITGNVNGVEYKNFTIIDQTEWQPYRIYDQSERPEGYSRSQVLTLTAGQLLRLDGYFAQGGGGDHLTLSVEVPHPDQALIDSTCGQLDQECDINLQSACNDPQSQQCTDQQTICQNTFNSCASAQVKNSLPEVQKVQLTYVTNHEQWSFHICPSNPEAKFYFKFQNPQLNDQNKLKWNKNTNAFKLSDWTANKIQGEFNNAAGDLNIQVLSGPTDDGNGCVDWVVELQYWKDESSLFQDIYAYLENNSAMPNGQASIDKTQNQDPPIRGNYKLTFELYNQFQETESLNYDWTTEVAGKIQSKFPGLTYETWGWGRGNEGVTYFIEFRGIAKGDLADLIPTSNNLTGGTSDDVQVIVSEVRKGSYNVFYEPVSQELLFQAFDTSQIEVTVNSVLAVCESDCSYKQTEELTPYLSPDYIYTPDYSLSLKISFNSSVPILSQSDFTVEFAKENCNIQSFSYQENVNGFTEYNIECFPPKIGVNSQGLDQNRDAVEAGEHRPVVHVKDIGFSVLAIPNRLRNLLEASYTIDIELLSLNHTTGSPLGGQFLTILGYYFPDSNADDIEVKFGNAVVDQIFSITNNAITLLTPAKSALDSNTVNVVVTCVVCNAQTQTPLQYTYSNTGVPTIGRLDFGLPVGLNPTANSPVLKGNITIKGNNFGTDISQIKVYITKEDSTEIVYYLRALVVSNTQITARLGGGITGNYKIRVSKNNIGYNLEYQPGISNFQYIIELKDVSPKSGSAAGGTVLTLTGKHFSENILEQQVFIGEEPNVMCHVTSVNLNDFGDDTLTCVTDPRPTESRYADEDGYVSGEPQPIYLVGRLIEDATCINQANCSYAYDLALTPNATTASFEPDNNIIVGQTYTIQGEGFNLGVIATVKIGSNYYPATIDSDTQVSFTAPALQSGTYTLIVNIEGIGYAERDADFKVTYPQLIDSISPNTGSSGGEIITIDGQGFWTSHDPFVQAYDNNGFVSTCYLISKSTTQITCKLVEDIGGNKVLNFRVFAKGTKSGFSYDDVDYNNPTQSLNYITSVDCTSGNCAYSSDTALAFSVTITNPNVINAGNLALQVQLDTPDLTGGKDIQTYLVCVSCNNQTPLNQFDLANQASNTLILALGVVPAGVYKLYIHIDGIGFGSADLTVNLVGTPSITTGSSSSYAGGELLTITGGGVNGLQGSAEVTVCGAPCYDLVATSNQITCKTPFYQSKAVWQTYLANTYQKSTSADFIDLSETIVFSNQEDQATVLANNGYSNVKQVLTDYSDLSFYNDDTNSCFFTFDFGANFVADIKGIQYQPYVGITEVDLFTGTVFEGSNDLNTWTEILKLDYTTHSGDNIIKNIETGLFRYIRVAPSADGGNCKFSKVLFYGYRFFSSAPASISTNGICDVQVSINGLPISLSGSSQVTYLQSFTWQLVDLPTRFASYNQDDELQIQLKVGLGGNPIGSFDDVQIWFSGIECVVSDGQILPDGSYGIYCDAGKVQKDDLCNDRSIEIRIQNHLVIYDSNQFKFYYGLFWSRDDTWGGELEPQEGDSVYIPKCMTLIVDKSPPKLKAVVIEGTIIWADGAVVDGIDEYTFDAEYIISRKGEIVIGHDSDLAPFTKKLTITLHGNIWGVQMPMFGNKCIANHQGTLDMHGLKKIPTWTLLDQDVQIGQNYIDLIETVNWQINDEIVIASSDFNPHHAERFRITAINGNRIILDGQFQYDHAGHDEIYDQGQRTWTFPFRAEVAVLTRNIVVQGDEYSEDQLYGVHIINMGRNSRTSEVVARIEYTEVRHAGQPKIQGRYPIHWHLNGDVRNSYAIGNSVHDSFARVTTIHGVSYLYYAWNVGYNAMGHNVFLEDGIETHNVIEYNCMIASKQVWFMLQTDVTVASYWITNPSNIIRHNRAGGSDFYGYWYEIVQHPDGPSSNAEICPRGMELEQFFNNTAHSNTRFGLRILELAHRKNPCGAVRNDKEVDPWKSNPSYTSYWSHFTTYRNNECGILAEFVGDSVFHDAMIADSFKAGFQAHVANMTREELVLRDSLVVGISQQFNPDWVHDYPLERLPNPHKDSAAAKTAFVIWSENNDINSVSDQDKLEAFFFGTRGIITPKTDQFNGTNLEFYNFGTGMSIIQSCSECHSVYLWVQGAKTTFFRNIHHYNSSQADYIYWEKHRREIFLFADGTFGTSDLTGLANKPHWVTPFWPHNNVPECIHTQPGNIDLNGTNPNIPNPNGNDKWDNSLICAGHGVTVRKMQLANPEDKELLTGIDVRVYNLHGRPIYDQSVPFANRPQLPNGRKTFSDGIDSGVDQIPFDQQFGNIKRNIPFICFCYECSVDTECTSKPDEVTINFNAIGLTWNQCLNEYLNNEYSQATITQFCETHESVYICDCAKCKANGNDCNGQFGSLNWDVCQLTFSDEQYDNDWVESYCFPQTKQHCVKWGCSVSMKIKQSNDRKLGFSFPVVTGYIYNLHWKEGIDWTHFQIEPSQWQRPYVINWDDNDNEKEEAIVLRFNYTDNREQWDMFRMISGKHEAPENPKKFWLYERFKQNETQIQKFWPDYLTTLTLTDVQNANPNDPTCNEEDWFIDKDLSLAYVCIDDIRDFYPKYDDTILAFSPLENFDEIVLNNRPNPNCIHGSHYHDPENQLLYVCVSGNKRTGYERIYDANAVSRIDERHSFDAIDMNAVRCRETCPRPLNTICERTGDFVLWSQVDWNAIEARKPITSNTWQSGVPQLGDDVLIPCELRVTLEHNTIYDFNSITVDGEVNIERGADQVTEQGQFVTIKAKQIWIRGGTFYAGTSGNPYKGTLDINLMGSRYDPYLFLDDILEISNKVLLVTGDLHLFGVSPQSVWTRLAANAIPGSNTITVVDASGWKVSDEIVLGPSNYVFDEYEKHTIQSITGNVITLVDNIQYFHYGDTQTITVSNGDNTGQTIDYQVENDQLGFDPKTFTLDLPGHSAGLDMRTAVGHLTRNIKIHGEDRDNWGGRVLAYQWVFIPGLGTENEQAQQTHSGRMRLSGVEIFNVGQRDTANAGVDFRYISKDRSTLKVDDGNGGLRDQYTYKGWSLVENCGIHDMNGWGVRNEDSKYLTVNNNVVFSAPKFLVRSLRADHVHITNNLLIGARKRALPESGFEDEIACVYAWTKYNPLSDDLLITGNVCQGSEDGSGFAIPMTDCTQKELNKFYGNMASQTDAGFIYEPAATSSGCHWAGDNAAYRSNRGFMVNPTGDSMEITLAIAVETHGGLHLRKGRGDTGGIVLAHVFTSDSLFVAHALQDCPECYASDPSNLCSDIIGIQLLVVAQAGENFPFKKKPSVFDALCNPTAVDGSSYIDNTIFVGFKPDLGVDGCQDGSNFAFRTMHKATDAQASTYLTEVECIDCDDDSFVYFYDPIFGQRGWFGGCGDFPPHTLPNRDVPPGEAYSFTKGFDCTGPNNNLLYDITHAKTWISHNHEVGQQIDYCFWRPINNGYLCYREDMALAEFQAFGEDILSNHRVNQKRMMQPVYLAHANQPGLNNTLNAWREWDWFGCCEPLNRRMMRFTGILTLREEYNVTYTGQNPFDAEHRLNLRTPEGEPNEWVIWRYAYQVPQSTQVTVNGQIVKPYRVHRDDPENDIDLRSKINICGAHNYYWWNYTIHFVVKATPECLVRVTLVNSVYITARFTMPLFAFFDNGYDSVFIDRVSALLNITTDRLKIVGLVYQLDDDSITNNNRLLQNNSEWGLVLFLDGQKAAQDPSTMTQEELENYDYEAELAKVQELQDLADTLLQAVQSGQVDWSDISFTLLTYKLYAVMPKDPNNPDVIDKPGDDSDDNGDDVLGDKDSKNQALEDNSTTIYMIVGIVVGIVIIATIVGLVVIAFRKKSKQIQGEIISQEDSPSRPRTPEELLKRKTKLSQVSPDKITPASSMKDLIKVEDLDSYIGSKVIDKQDASSQNLK